MNWQAFEDKMRDESRGQEIPVDTDALWHNIQQKRKRRVPPFIWWMTGAIVLTGITAGLYPFVVLQNAGNSGVSHKEDAATWAATQQQSASATNPEYNLRSASQLPIGPSDHTTHSVPPPKSNNLLIAKSVLAEKPNQLAPHLNESNSFYIPASTDATKVPKPNENNRPLAVFVDNTAQPNNNLPFNPQPNTLHPRLNNSIIEQGLSAAKPVTMEQEADSISTVFLQSSKYEILTLLPHAETELIAPYCQPKFYNFKKKSKKAAARHAIDIGLDAGYYGWNILRVKDVNPLPRNGEKNLEAFHLGVHLKGKMAGHFFISSGIQFNQLNSVYQWNQEWDSLSNRLTTIEYSNGEIDSSYSWETTLHHFKHTVKNFNKITTWSIPIDLQYAFQAGKWTISPYAGLQAQFYQRSQGVISGGNNRPSVGPYSSIYKNPFVLSMRTGVNCEFPVGRNTRMSVSPTAIIDLMSRVNNPTYPGEIFRQVGIHVGINRKISF